MSFRPQAAQLLATSLSIQLNFIPGGNLAGTEQALLSVQLHIDLYLLFVSLGF